MTALRKTIIEEKPVVVETTAGTVRAPISARPCGSNGGKDGPGDPIS